MTTPAKSSHRLIAALRLERSVPALITQAQSIVRAIANSPAFPSPTPPLTVVTDAVQELQAAETATRSRAVGTATARDEKRTALVGLLEQLKNHVQSVADASAATSSSIIESAGIAVKRTGVRPPRVFGAMPGAVSGSATLVTKTAALRAAYEWQYSHDAGTTWLTAPTTLQSKTTIAGLTPGARATFRSRSVTKAGEGDWSQLTSLIVG